MLFHIFFIHSYDMPRQDIRERLRRKLLRVKRERDIKQLQSYVDWCQGKVFVRDEHGCEHPVTTQEALEFIIATSPSEE